MITPFLDNLRINLHAKVIMYTKSATRRPIELWKSCIGYDATQDMLS